jgi:hypothetical protein
MKLSITAFTIACAILWGGGVLLVAIANLVWPTYGTAFLELLASVYPGYHAAQGGGSVVVATLYGLADGAITGAIFAWLYNLLAR